MRESLRQYCRRMGLEWLAAEFDCVKNTSLTPETLSYGSRVEVWWRCKEGHAFQASPSSRRGGTRCPYCAGQRAIPGVNDLATLNPELAAEWHPTKNGDLKPSELLPGSKKLVWWRCEKGHEWTAFPAARVGGSGCPICAKERAEEKDNRLPDKFPALAAEWHPLRNGTLRPEDVSIDSGRKVWWRCDKGHEWQATVLSRASGDSPCPICSGRKLLKGVNDLKTAAPWLAAEWASENAPLTPSDVAAGSSRRVWWRCKEGHLWRASIAARAEEHKGCPYCSGKRRAKEPQVLHAPMPHAAVSYPGERPAV